MSQTDLVMYIRFFTRLQKGAEVDATTLLPIRLVHIKRFGTGSGLVVPTHNVQNLL